MHRFVRVARLTSPDWRLTGDADTTTAWPVPANFAVTPLFLDQFFSWEEVLDNRIKVKLNEKS